MCDGSLAARGVKAIHRTRRDERTKKTKQRRQDEKIAGKRTATKSQRQKLRRQVPKDTVPGQVSKVFGERERLLHQLNSID